MPISSTEFTLITLGEFIQDMEADGKLIPEGGGAGMVLTKNTSANGDLIWATIASGVTLLNTVYKQMITGNGSDTEFELTHNLNSDVITISVLDNTGVITDAGWQQLNGNVVKIIFSSAPENGENFNVRILFG